MFGLDDDKKKGKETEEFFFDLEQDIKDNPEKLKELQSNILDKLKELKEALKEGVDPKALPTYQKIMQGYLSASQIISAIGVKSKET